MKQFKEKNIFITDKWLYYAGAGSVRMTNYDKLVFTNFIRRVYEANQYCKRFSNNLEFWSENHNNGCVNVHIRNDSFSIVFNFEVKDLNELADYIQKSITEDTED